MDLPGFLVERANPDTLGAIHPSRAPVGVTSFGVDVPFQNTGLIGYIVAPGRHFAVGKGLRRTVLCAGLAGFAEFHHAERTVAVIGQRQIREDLAQPHPRTEGLGHEKAHPAPLAQTGRHGQGNAQRGVVAARDREKGPRPCIL